MDEATSSCCIQSTDHKDETKHSSRPRFTFGNRCGPRVWTICPRFEAASIGESLRQLISLIVLGMSNGFAFGRGDNMVLSIWARWSVSCIMCGDHLVISQRPQHSLMRKWERNEKLKPYTFPDSGFWIGVVSEETWRTRGSPADTCPIRGCRVNNGSRGDSGMNIGIDRGQWRAGGNSCRSR